MPLVYMNSWGSLALRAAALAAFGIALLAGSARGAVGACALLLAASAAHPLSISLRLGGSTDGLMSLAEGAIALAIAAMLAVAAGLGGPAVPDAAALAAPLAPGLLVLALVSGLGQHVRLRRSAGGAWPALPVAIASGSAGVALLAALVAQAVANESALPAPGLAVAAVALAAWIMHSALRLRRARRTAMRALQRDWALVRPVRQRARSAQAVPAPESRLRPAAQWS